MKATASTLYPFVPSGGDYPLALRFFAFLGFKKEWEYPGVSGLRFGGAYFILQQADIPEWQTNQMVTFEVDDLEGYWTELQALDLPAQFPGVRINPPKDFPWGRELHIIDPAGVCWHIRKSAAA